MGDEEVEGGVVWHLVGLPGPEQDEVDEASMEEMAEPVVLKEEASLEDIVADLEADGAGSEPDVVELEPDVVELEPDVVELEEDVVELGDDDVEQVDEPLENHPGDRSSCPNQEGGNRTLEVSILGPSYEYLKQLDDEARVLVEGLQVVVVVPKQAPLVYEAVAVEAGPALALICQITSLGHVHPPDLLRLHFSRSLLFLGRLQLLQLFPLLHVCSNLILKQN